MQLGTKIKKLRKVVSDNYSVTLEYQDGIVGVVDLSRFFADKKKPLIAEILRGNLFSKCFIESGALAWPNGYELCPDVLRAMLKESSRKKAA